MVQQVRTDFYFPSGDRQPLLAVRFSPEELTSRYGWEFEQTFDDLDWMEMVAIQLSNGARVVFDRYRHDTEPGTVAHIDSEANFTQTRSLLMEVLNLSEEDIIWTSPRVEGFEEGEE